MTTRRIARPPVRPRAHRRPQEALLVPGVDLLGIVIAGLLPHAQHHIRDTVACTAAAAMDRRDGPVVFKASARAFDWIGAARFPERP